ncbi:MAG TPA: glycosyltransferase [Capillimicrobium sp.]|nr:glycosyltransferase [Capillimicrobium sp.]
MTTLSSVALAALPTERFRAVLDDADYDDLLMLRERARRLLAGRALWCVSSTATGGGVAEMLRSLLAYTRGAGVDSRWVVVGADGAFFDVTKRLHNWLHESPAADGALDDAARRAYEAVTAAAGQRLAELVRPGDVVLLHDPQTLGMAPALRGRGVRVVWRSHIGVDDPGERAAAAWAFLRPYLRDVQACVFSRERFVWAGLEGMPVAIVPPSIDVFSPKNQEMSDATVRGILCAAGIVEGRGGPAMFEREDGTPARVDRRATIVQERPLREDDRYVTQVSRWDRLKDPVGVLEGFVSHVGETGDAHLLLVGPDVAGVSDDPEGQAVLAEVVAAWRALPRPARLRVHLATLPMDDPEENAATVNAIQRHAAVVVQKSLAEGFGLSVTEAAWKARPIVASGVGGIQDQVVDRVTGLLVDPADLAAFGHAVSRLLSDPALARRLGEAACERVRERFLEPRHLRQWVDLIEGLETTSPPPAPEADRAARRRAAADPRSAAG